MSLGIDVSYSSSPGRGGIEACDFADIEGILDVRTDLDLDHIRRWLREFSSVLEMPEIQEDFERLLRRKPTR